MGDDPNTSLVISCFGPLDVRVHGRPLPRLRSRMGHRLLSLLTLRAGREVSRSWLAGTLWPDSTESQALVSLRSSLVDLRHGLGPAAPRLRSPTLHTLCLDLADAQVDLLAFDAAITRGDPVALEQAVALYRGPLLEGWSEEWVFEERQARAGAYLEALERLAQHALEQGSPGEAERWLGLVIAAAPLQETAHRMLMTLLAESGRYAAAGKLYRDLRSLLHGELNAQPAPETTALYERIRSEARVRSRPPPGSEDSPTAQHDADSRAAPTPRNVRGWRSRLPRPLTRLIGREQEVAATRAALAGARLVTLTGAGGVGKTRLALRVAETVAEECRDGIGFVDLAPLADEALVPHAVAGVLEVWEQPQTPLVETLTAYLEDKALLLVLDNCEHVVEECARLVEALLSDCSELRILATSRQPLGLFGEVCRPVPSLAEADAVQLFVERAAAARPSFARSEGCGETVAGICRQLDGIPLAIELAAARVKGLAIEKLAERLDQRFRLLTGGSRTALPRHQTLRALIDWSYDLLSEGEQALLRRLSVFAGGWTLEAAEAVCSKSVDSGWWLVDRSGGDNDTDQEASIGVGLTTNYQPLSTDFLDVLTSLVDKSLVQYEERAGEGRYRLLETVRQYARDRLEERGEAEAVRRRHRDWYMALSERGDWLFPYWSTAGEHPDLQDPWGWMERLDVEHDNLQAALEWSAVREEIEAGLRLAAALAIVWGCRGYSTEALGWLERLLAQGSGASAGVRAKALVGAGRLATIHDDSARGRELVQQGRALFQEIGDQRGMAGCLLFLALPSLYLGDLTSTRALLEESLASFRVSEYRPGIAWCFLAMSMLSEKVGDSALARALAEESLALCRVLGVAPETLYCLYCLGGLACEAGDYAGARAHLTEGLALAQQMGYPHGMAFCLRSFAALTAAEDQRERAVRLFGAAEGLLEAVGIRPYSEFRRDSDGGEVAAVRTVLGEAAFAAAWAEGRAMTREAAISLALEPPERS